MKKRRAFLFCVLLAVSPALAATPLVRTGSGSVEGVRADGVEAYLGIPYAAPPVGDLRWRPPQPVSGWKDVRPARAFAPACMQVGVSMPGEQTPWTSEDCLYLNVWTPAQRKARLPVMVWIH